MSDFELLNAAAKAAGLKFAVNGEGLPGLHVCGPSWEYGWCLWNPLTNDGDALRLAVKLHIDVEWQGDGEVYANDQQQLADWSHHGGSESSALRRAIVRAAAAQEQAAR